MAQETKKDSKPKNLKYLGDKSREMVKGIFRFYEVPGGCIDFNYREFKEFPIERYTMLDGEVYTIPLGVARHLNKNCWYPEYDFVAGDNSMRQSNVSIDGRSPFSDGKTQRVTKKVRRMGFQSLEFVDIEDLPQIQSSVVTVETV